MAPTNVEGIMLSGTLDFAVKKYVECLPPYSAGTTVRAAGDSLGRARPTGDIGCQAAQLGGQLSGGDFGGVAVCGRPISDILVIEIKAANETFIRTECTTSEI